MNLSSEEEENYSNLKKSIEHLIGVPTSEIRKKATEDDEYAKLFCKSIQNIDDLRQRDFDLAVKFNVDFDNFNIPFYDTIETLLELSFPDPFERGLIYQYIYNRKDDIGNPIPIDVAGKELYIQTPKQLLGVIRFIRAQNVGH